MHTKQITTLYRFIFTALIFLFLGLTTSPTGVSGYHIIIFIPALILLFRGQGRFKLSGSSISLILLFLWGLLSTIVNFDTIIKPNKAFQDIKYYAFGVLCIPAIQYFIKFDIKKHQRILLNILLITVVIGFFVGVSKAYFSFDPVKWRFGEFHERSGGFNNYMRYGYSSGFMLLLSVGAFLFRGKIKEYVGFKWLIVFMLFNFTAIITSQTRGAVLGIIVASPFLLFKFRPLAAKVISGVGACLLILITVVSFSKELSRGDNRMININDGSNKKRLSQFYSAAMAIKDNPVFGLGADQFSYNVKDIKNKYNIWAKDYSGHAHNIFLEHGANYGIPGMLLFLSFLILWFVEMIKLKSDFGWIVASYILAYTTSGQVELVLDVINSHLLFFIYSFSQVAIINKNQKDKV